MFVRIAQRGVVNVQRKRAGLERVPGRLLIPISRFGHPRDAAHPGCVSECGVVAHLSVASSVPS